MMTEKTKKKAILLVGIIAPFVISLMYFPVLLSRVNYSLYLFLHRLWTLFAITALAYFGIVFALLTRRENKFLSNLYVKIVVAFIYFLFYFVFTRQYYSFRERNINIPSWWDWELAIGGVLSLFIGGYLAKIKGGNRKWLNEIEKLIAGSVPPIAATLLLFIWYEGTVLIWQFLGVG